MAHMLHTIPADAFAALLQMARSLRKSLAALIMPLNSSRGIDVLARRHC